MIKVATAKEMQHIDRVTIEKYGISGTVLMERAGLLVVKRINEIFFSNPPVFPLNKEDTGGCCIKKIIVINSGCSDVYWTSISKRYAFFIFLHIFFIITNRYCF